MFLTSVSLMFYSDSIEALRALKLVCSTSSINLCVRIFSISNFFFLLSFEISVVDLLDSYLFPSDLSSDVAEESP